MQTKHTPTPWRVDTDDGVLILADAEAVPAICEMSYGLADYNVNYNITKAMRKVNADFIVRACNSHDALVDAVKALLSELSPCEVADLKSGRFESVRGISSLAYKKALSALKLAKG